MFDRYLQRDQLTKRMVMPDQAMPFQNECQPPFPLSLFSLC